MIVPNLQFGTGYSRQRFGDHAKRAIGPVLVRDDNFLAQVMLTRQTLSKLRPVSVPPNIIVIKG